MGLSKLFEIDTPNAETAAQLKLPISSYYTIFNPNYTMGFPPTESAFIAESTGRKLGSIIVYQPEREALHHTMAYTSLVSRYLNDQQLAEVIDALQEDYVLPAISETAIALRNVWKALSQDINTDHPEEAAQAVEKYYNNPLHMQLKEEVQNQITTAIEDGLLKPLSFSNSSQALVLSAASGSGKTTLSRIKTKEMLNESGQELDDFCLIYRDRFTPVLLGNMKTLSAETGEAFAWLAFEEAGQVMACTQDALQDLAQTGIGIPNLVFERATDISKVVRNLQEAGPHTHCCFIYVPTVSAMLRANKRAYMEMGDTQITGRFDVTANAKNLDVKGDYHKLIPTDAMLKMHKTVSSDFRKLLLSGPQAVTFEIFDNTVSHGKPPTIIASGNLATGMLQIKDVRRFALFMQKQSLNLNATHPKELYEQPISIDGIPEALKKLSIVEFLSNKNDVVCRYTIDSGLEIIDHEKLSSMRCDKLADAIIQSLDNEKDYPDSKILSSFDFLIEQESPTK